MPSSPTSTAITAHNVDLDVAPKQAYWYKPSMPPLTVQRKASSQRGATLIVSLMLLLVLTILALSLYQFGNSEERNARNLFDRNLALQAAELALRDAEMDLQCLRIQVPAAVAPNPAYTVCTANSIVNPLNPAILCRATCAIPTLSARALTGFDAAGTNGLWAGAVNTQPWVRNPPFFGTDPFGANSTTSVVLGTQTNVAIPAIYQNSPPRYMIEGFQQATGQLLYRITSRGWGTLPGTVVTLQEIYKP